MTDRLRRDTEARITSWTWNATAMVFHFGVINGVLLYLWTTGGEYLVHARIFGNHPIRDAVVGLAVGVGLAGAARLSVWRAMWWALVRRSSPPSLGGRVLLCCTGAWAEELLFRGVLTGLAGPIGSTLLFAATHVPTERALAPWPLSAVLTGAVFAALQHHTGAVVASVVAHTCWELSGRTVDRFSRASTSTGSAT